MYANNSLQLSLRTYKLAIFDGISECCYVYLVIFSGMS